MKRSMQAINFRHKINSASLCQIIQLSQPLADTSAKPELYFYG